MATTTQNVTAIISSTFSSKLKLFRGGKGHFKVWRKYGVRHSTFDIRHSGAGRLVSSGAGRLVSPGAGRLRARVKSEVSCPHCGRDKYFGVFVVSCAHCGREKYLRAWDSNKNEKNEVWLKRRRMSVRSFLVLFHQN